MLRKFTVAIFIISFFLSISVYSYQVNRYFRSGDPERGYAAPSIKDYYQSASNQWEHYYYTGSKWNITKSKADYYFGIYFLVKYKDDYIFAYPVKIDEENGKLKYPTTGESNFIDVSYSLSNLKITYTTEKYWKIPGALVFVADVKKLGDAISKKYKVTLSYSESSVTRYGSNYTEAYAKVFMYLDLQENLVDGTFKELKYYDPNNRENDVRLLENYDWILAWFKITGIDRLDWVNIENAQSFTYKDETIFGAINTLEPRIKVNPEKKYIRYNEKTCDSLVRGPGIQTCNVSDLIEFKDFDVICNPTVAKGGNLVCHVTADGEDYKNQEIYYEIIGTNYEGHTPIDDNGNFTVPNVDLAEDTYTIEVYPYDGEKIDIGDKKGSFTFSVKEPEVEDIQPDIREDEVALNGEITLNVTLSGYFLEAYNGQKISYIVKRGNEIIVPDGEIEITGCSNEKLTCTLTKKIKMTEIGKNITVEVSFEGITGSDSVKVYKEITLKSSYLFTAIGDLDDYNTIVINGNSPSKEKTVKLYESTGRINATSQGYTVTVDLSDTDTEVNLDDYFKSYAKVTNIEVPEGIIIPYNTMTNIPVTIEGNFLADAGKLFVNLSENRLADFTISSSCTQTTCSFEIPIKITELGRNKELIVYWGGNPEINDTANVSVYHNVTIISGLTEIYVNVTYGDAEVIDNGTNTVTVQMYSEPINITITPVNDFGGKLEPINLTLTTLDSQINIYSGDYYAEIKNPPSKMYYWRSYNLEIESNFYWTLKLPNGTSIMGNNNTTVTVFVNDSWPVGDQEIELCLGTGSNCSSYNVEIYANTTIISELPLRSVKKVSGRDVGITKVNDTIWRVYYTSESVTVKLYPKNDSYNPKSVTINKEYRIREIPKSYFEYSGKDYIKILDYTEEVEIGGNIKITVETTGTARVEINNTEKDTKTPSEIPGKITLEFPAPDIPGTYTYTIYLVDNPNVREDITIRVYFLVNIEANVDISRISYGSGIYCWVEDGEGYCKLYKDKDFTIGVYPEDSRYSPVELDISTEGNLYIIEFEGAGVSTSETMVPSGGYVNVTLGKIPTTYTPEIDQILEDIPTSFMTKLGRLISEYKNGRKEVLDEIINIINNGETVDYPIIFETRKMNLTGYKPIITGFSLEVEYQYFRKMARIILKNVENKVFDLILVSVPVETSKEKKEINGMEYLEFRNTNEISFTVNLEDIQSAIEDLEIYTFEQITPPKVTGAFIKVDKILKIGIVIAIITTLGLISVRKYLPIILFDYSEIEEYLRDKRIVSKKEIVKVFRDREKIKRALKKMWKEGKISINKHDILYHG